MLIDNEVIRTGEAKATEEVSKIVADKSVHYLSHKVPLKNKHGETVGILGVSLDITKTKQEIEDRFKMLEDIISVMPANVYWMNKDGVYMGCNDNEAKAIGLASRKDIIGKRNIDIPGFLIPEVLDPVNKDVMENGKTVVLEEPAILRDGTEAIFISSKVPLRNDRGEINGMVGISVDITDRKKAEKEAEKLKLENVVHKVKLQEHEKFKEAAMQVAHDIRSPLAVLNVMARRVSQLPEEQRLMIRNAAQRINDIANNLLARYDTNNPANNEQDANLDATDPRMREDVSTSDKTTELVLTILDSIISEKRIQYAGRPVDFNIIFTGKECGLFVDVNLSVFKRVLSNIINNAVEALGDFLVETPYRASKPAENNEPATRDCQYICQSETPYRASLRQEKGLITIKLNQDKDSVLISIIDNGKGIAQEKLANIFTAKISDKKGGHGLGLPHAKDCVEKWNGQISIESTMGQGSEIKISLPKAPDPDWFIPQITINKDAALVVLDDDNSIHDVWHSRLEQMGDKVKNIRVKDFMNPESLIQYFSSVETPYRASLQQERFLIDYELVGHKLNGIDVIEKLGIMDKAILVTSRFEDPKIRERCEFLGLKMIPKSFSPYIPIKIMARESGANLPTENVSLETSDNLKNPYCVFLDDMKSVTDLWEMIAKKQGKQIATFNDANKFKEYIKRCKKRCSYLHRF